MKWKQVKHQWPAVQAVVKRTWGKIDEADLTAIHGERDSFVRILGQRYGYAEAVAQKKVDAFILGLKTERKGRMGLAWLPRLLQKCWRHIHVPGRR
ncbi:MAG: hypothetical protein WBD20_19755 [Pirellulaceae bacterium]